MFQMDSERQRDVEERFAFAMVGRFQLSGFEFDRAALGQEGNFRHAFSIEARYIQGMQWVPWLVCAASLGAAEIKVSGWTDSGIDVTPGDEIRIEVTGEVRGASGGPAGPSGVQKGWKDLLRTFPVNDANRAAAIARIGDRTRPFLVAEKIERRAPIAGRLFLGINAPDGEVVDGEFRAKVSVMKRDAPPINESALPRLTQEQLDQLPARVEDADGTPGDRVNFIIVGAEDRVVGALIDQGWVKVDRTPEDAVGGALKSILNRRGYVEIPMSELMMFGRAQDYGFAMGDPVRVIAERHHFRLWKAPFTAGGEAVWVGAGTHDIGFDKDQRNGKVTHKIDPDTDKERDFIVESLRQSGEAARVYYLTRKDPVKEAKTAHGGEFFSDGRTAIVILNPALKTTPAGPALR
jgi:hypothetical protein